MGTVLGMTEATDQAEEIFNALRPDLSASINLATTFNRPNQKTCNPMDALRFKLELQQYQERQKAINQMKTMNRQVVNQVLSRQAS